MTLVIFALVAIYLVFGFIGLRIVAGLFLFSLVFAGGVIVYISVVDNLPKKHLVFEPAKFGSRSCKPSPFGDLPAGCSP